MRSEEQINAFIHSFKEVFPIEIEFTFTNGHCYWFANILAQRFHGDIWFNPALVHFACLIDGNLYDIYGKVTPYRFESKGELQQESFDKWTSWDDFQRNHQDAVQDIVDTCIKKVR